MKALRRVISGAVGTSQFSEGGRGLMDRVLLVCQTGPMGAVDEEHSHRERWEGVSPEFENGEVQITYCCPE
jgi:hypothetical protein